MTLKLNASLPKNIIGRLTGEFHGGKWTAVLKDDGTWECGNEIIQPFLAHFTPEAFRMFYPLDQRAYGVGGLVEAARALDAVAEVHPDRVRDPMADEEGDNDASDH